MNIYVIAQTNKWNCICYIDDENTKCVLHFCAANVLLVGVVLCVHTVVVCTWTDVIKYFV